MDIKDAILPGGICMNLRKRWTSCLACMILIVTMVWSLCACGDDGDAARGPELDVLRYIDWSSLTQEGDYTNFRVVTEEGKTIRFQGKGVAVTESGISMEPGSYLVSLDYLGAIPYFDVTSDTAGCGINFGFAFTNAPAVDNMTQLNAAFVWWMMVEENTRMNLSEVQSGFLVMQAEPGNAQPLNITSLKIRYDDTVEQVFYKDLAYDSQEMDFFALYPTNWEVRHTEGDPHEAIMAKLEEPGIIQSDIIAGIDHSTIAVDGTTTFFSSVMSDGTVVRFEGENISIDESGITIRPDSAVTSLDAVGKIYGYCGYIANGDSYGQDATLDYGYGYTYSAEKNSVERAAQVHTYDISGDYPLNWNEGLWHSVMAFEPNFVYFSGNTYYQQEFVVSGLSIAYNPAEKTTPMVDAAWNLDFTSAYLEGERYNQAKEALADESKGSFDFYLCLLPDTPYSYLTDNGGSVYFVPNTFYTVGDLRDAAGNVLDKSNARVEAGTTLDITVGDYAFKLEVPVIERYIGAETMHDLVPYAFPDALGVNNTLVVPVAWADQKDNANEDTLVLYRKNLGRIMDATGNITDYSDPADREFSLSEYFEIASYGKLTVNSFLTDWYYSDRNFAEAETDAPDKYYVDEILGWVKAQYPDIDWSLYDQDANGYVDSIVLINAGTPSNDSYIINSYSGAIHYRESYFGDYAGTPKEPNAHTFVNINDRFLRKEGADTLIHEFSHNFGIIDYYDVTYSGINAVGGFDMQSDNKGDWNAYSKIAVGWMEPQVVSGLDSGESVEFTIGSSALTEDVIVIPAAGTQYEGVFGEYVMIDLFSDDGVNQYDTKEYGLQDALGVRISHVNGCMEKRTIEAESKTTPGEVSTYDIGTIHYANNYVGDGMGRYNVEVIQAGKKNTFTTVGSMDLQLSKEDLFYAGDTFTAEEYSEFFYQGLMDDGRAFGYTITIVAVGKDAEGKPMATVRVTAQ